MGSLVRLSGHDGCDSRSSGSGVRKMKIAVPLARKHDRGGDPAL